MTANRNVKAGPAAAWGVEFGGSAVRLARLVREGDAYRLDRCVEAPLPDRWDATATPAQAAAALAGEAPREPLAACLGDELVLYRGLTLPGGEPAAIQAMIDRQAEALIPGEGFAHAWQSQANPQAGGSVEVLIAAARREMVSAAAAGAAACGRVAEAVVPAMAATAAGWGALCGGSGEAVLLVDVSARCTGVAISWGGVAGRCDVIDMGGDAVTEALAKAAGVPPRQAEERKLAGGAEAGEAVRGALTRWGRSLREAYEHCAAGLPEERRPKRCVLVGRGARLAGLADRAAAALGMPAAPAHAPAGPAGADTAAFLTAAGAAMAAMELGPAKMNLLERKARRRGSWRIGRPWAVAAGWALAALLALWGLDLAAAARTGAALQRARERVGSPGALERQLAMGRYLESLGPTPAEAVEAISQALSGKALLASLNCRGRGEVALTGTVGNEQELMAALESLGKAGAIETRNVRPENNRLRFEVTVRLGPGASGGGAATKPAAPARAAGSEKGGRP